MTRSGMQREQKGRVLLAEDEPGLLRHYRRILDGAGYDVEVADDGASGVALYKTGGFDVVVSDVSMPGMDGIELLRQIHAFDQDAPVVLMTGGPSVGTAIEAIEYGALKYLTKPFAPSELIASVSRAIAHRHIVRAQHLATERAAEADREEAERQKLDAALDRALSTLWMAVQPIVVWGERAVRGYEALMRSVEPALPHPGAILAAAEKLDRVVDVGRTVRERVAAIAHLLPVDADIYVNLHPTELTDETLYDPQGPLSELASRVVLEITERASLRECPELATRIRRLRAMGFRLALDDLGSGYAALNSMSMLEPQVVKIDMGLVRDIHVSPTKQKIVHSITQLCHSLEIQVVAEGIETPLERDVLAVLGVDMMQGYLFAKPAKPCPDVVW